ncbi:hypothetical protein SKAU_G00107910 [Synaphobranchus kaupii]|uniref:Uncharacterized protein n=1 Tax=Synaphobranchus kaupii TaxID=118154 RepID=A0A9Q1FZN6_SYNKA|nr:hypothetical protein SKAU_G00107910 [Synaphobranchus kaupii]
MQHSCSSVTIKIETTSYNWQNKSSIAAWSKGPDRQASGYCNPVDLHASPLGFNPLAARRVYSVPALGTEERLMQRAPCAHSEAPLPRQSEELRGEPAA